MVESPLKRQREETRIEEAEVEETKRHKSSSLSSYNHILSLLIDEAEEEEPAQDLSSLMTSLQQELYSESNNTFDQETSNPITSSSSCSKEDEVDDKKRVMRHLLEASDDELGIPSMEVSGADSVDCDEVTGTDSVDVLALCDGLWDLEDDSANYHTPCYSELIM